MQKMRLAGFKHVFVCISDVDIFETSQMHLLRCKDIHSHLYLSYPWQYINQNNLITTVFAYISVKIELVYKYLKNTLYKISEYEIG